MLSKTLKTDLPSLAALLASHGRGKDRMLAHITPREAEMLKARGGSGSVNPKTGLLEFDDSGIETVTSTAPYTPAPDISGVTNSLYTPAPAPKAAQASAAAAPTAAPAAQDAAPMLPVNYAPQAAPETVTVHGQAPTQAATADYNAVLPSPGGEQAAQPTGNTTTSFGEKAKNYLTDPENLLKLGGIGALGFLGLNNANKVGPQAATQQKELGALAQPFQQAGEQALAGATSGNLTPQNARALEAARAQIGQSMAGGGVSAEQGAQQISEVFANLLQEQLNQAIQLLQVANQYTQAAINAGYQTTQAGQTATANFFQNLAATAARVL